MTVCHMIYRVMVQWADSTLFTQSTKLSWTKVGVRATKDTQLAYIVDINIDMAVFIFKQMMFMI